MKRNNRFLRSAMLAGIPLLFFAACNDAPVTSGQPAATNTATPAAIAKASDMQWLAGKWQNSSPEGIAYENWEQVSESVFHAVSGFIKGKDTMISETVSLEQQGSDLVYIPTVKDQNNGQPVPFKLIIADHDSFVFENKAHDFPQRITYIKQSADVLLAKISGNMVGKEHTESFPMTRVK